MSVENPKLLCQLPAALVAGPCTVNVTAKTNDTENSLSACTRLFDYANKERGWKEKTPQKEGTILLERICAAAAAVAAVAE